MGARDTIERLSSQWPPKASSVLSGVLTAGAAIAVSVVSWLGMAQISSQVLQAQNAQAIATTKVVVSDTATKVDDLAKHDARVAAETASALNGINLTTQRLADMLARHEADIQEMRADARAQRRRSSQTGSRR